MEWKISDNEGIWVRGSTSKTTYRNYQIAKLIAVKNYT